METKVDLITLDSKDLEIRQSFENLREVFSDSSKRGELIELVREARKKYLQMEKEGIIGINLNGYIPEVIYKKPFDYMI